TIAFTVSAATARPRAGSSPSCAAGRFLDSREAAALASDRENGAFAAGSRRVAQARPYRSLPGAAARRLRGGEGRLQARSRSPARGAPTVAARRRPQREPAERAGAADGSARATGDGGRRIARLRLRPPRGARGGAARSGCTGAAGGRGRGRGLLRLHFHRG